MKDISTPRILWTTRMFFCFPTTTIDSGATALVICTYNTLFFHIAYIYTISRLSSLVTTTAPPLPPKDGLQPNQTRHFQRCLLQSYRGP